MRKEDLIYNISKKTGIPKVDVMIVLESYFKEIKGSLSEGESVYVRSFGTFTLKHRAQKTARNIRANTTVIVPAQVVPYFKPSKEFVDDVRQVSLSVVEAE